MTDQPDFVKEDTPSEDLAAQIRVYSTALVDLMVRAAAKERELEDMRAQIYELSSKTIPEKMMEARMDRCGLPDLGYDVRMKDWVRAVLPRPTEEGGTVDRDRATEWLDGHGYGSLIKTEVTAQFDKTERNMAISAAEKLREEFPEKRVIVREDVHHMTYTAWARERLKAGESLPMDLLGITSGKVAEVVKRKED